MVLQRGKNSNSFFKNWLLSMFDHIRGFHISRLLTLEYELLGDKDCVRLLESVL